jgi:hypothetical protein
VGSLTVGIMDCYENLFSALPCPPQPDDAGCRPLGAQSTRISLKYFLVAGNEFTGGDLCSIAKPTKVLAFIRPAVTVIAVIVIAFIIVVVT